MKTKRIPIRETVSGHSLDLEVTEFSGSTDQVVHIQANVHGSEVMGNGVIYFLREYFQHNPPLATVRLVPYANPVGVNAKMGMLTYGRFDTETGDNFNRTYFDTPLSDAIVAELRDQPDEKLVPRFKQYLKDTLAEQARRASNGGSYPRKLAYTLQDLAVEADYVLDLHCACRSVPYVYAPTYSLQDTHYLHFSHYLAIPCEFAGAMDEAVFVPWWKLAQKLDRPLRQQGFTIELGNDENFSFAEAEDFAKKIINYLRHMGCVTGEAVKPEAAQVCDLGDFAGVYAQAGGLVDYVARPGTPVRKGETLYEQLTREGRVRVAATQDCTPIFRNQSSAVHSGTELMRLFTKVRSLEA